MKFIHTAIAAVLFGSATLIASVGATDGTIRGLQGQSQNAAGKFKDIKVNNNGNNGNGGGNNGNGNGNGSGKPKKTKFIKAKQNGINDQYIIVFEDAVKDEDVEALADSLVARWNNGKKLGKPFRSALKGFAARLTEAEAMTLSEMAEVKYVEQDAEVHANEIWGLDRVDQRNLPLDNSYFPGTNADGSNVTAYIVDTGIQISHNEFGNRATWGTNTADNRDEDCNGHGTHVAGTVGGTLYGVAKEVDLVAVKVLTCSGSGTNAGVIAGVDWVRARCLESGGPCVANMSLGGGFSSALNAAVATAVDAGIPFVVAAGNANSNACNSSPASEPKAITVGSTTNTDARSSFSNYGSCVDIFAPGSGITAAWIGSNTATNTISGTSMASPHAAGIAALYLSQDPSLTPDDVVTQMTNLATPGKVSNPGSGSPNLLAYAPYEPYVHPCVSNPNDPCPYQGSCMGVCENGSCVLPDDPATITLMLSTDDYASETSWELNDSSNNMVGSNSGYTSNGADYCEQVTVEKGVDHTFKIMDAYGDGMCCSYGPGGYKLYTGKTMAKNGGVFASLEETTFSVEGGEPPCGGTCGGSTPYCVDDKCVECSTDNTCPDTGNVCTINKCNANTCVESTPDADDDGTPDCNDSCPNDFYKISPGQCGCGNVDTDTDDDGTADCNDNCPIDPLKTNPGQCGCGVAEGTCAVCGDKSNGRKCRRDFQCQSCNCESRRCQDP